jgi:hypothetical protein
MPLLDTQKITDDLTAAGVNNQQARLFASKMEEAAHIIRGDLTTKADLKGLENALKAVEQELRSKIQLVRMELRGDMKDMTNRLTLIFASLLGLAVAVLKLWP